LIQFPLVNQKGDFLPKLQVIEAAIGPCILGLGFFFWGFCSSTDWCRHPSHRIGAQDEEAKVVAEPDPSKVCFAVGLKVYDLIS